MNELEILGRNIKRLREKRGLTAPVVAAHINMDPGYYRKIEEGRMWPRSSTLAKLGVILKCRMVDFWAYGVKQPAKQPIKDKGKTAA